MNEIGVFYAVQNMCKCLTSVFTALRGCKR